MGLRNILATGALLAAAGLGSASGASADVLTYGCGKGSPITISVNPEAGKGTFADSTAQGPLARAPLVPDQQGAWVNKKLGISFLPESSPPTVSAGDAEFKCSQKETAAAPPKPDPARETYKCATITVVINRDTRKGSYKDSTAPQMAGSLAEKKDGLYHAKDDAAIFDPFDPNKSAPMFEAGDAQFKCRQTGGGTN